MNWKYLRPVCHLSAFTIHYLLSAIHCLFQGSRLFGIRHGIIKHQLRDEFGESAGVLGF